MFETLLLSILPVFLIIGLGAALQRYGFFPKGFVAQLNHLTYWVALPAFLFFKLATTEQRLDPALRVLPVVMGATIAMMAVGYLLVWVLKVPGGSRGVFVQACYRGNLAFTGLPVVVYAVGAHMEAVAILVLAPMVVLLSGSAVMILLSDGNQNGGKLPGLDVIRRTAVNPMFLSSSIGGVVALLGWRPPAFLALTGEIVGQLALPLALISIGATTASIPLKGNMRYALVTAFAKVALVPLLALPIAWATGLSGDELKVALIYCATPTAAASYVMSAKLGGNDALAASSVTLSTILSFFSLSAVILWMH